MGAETGISWTDSTWNPWMGCHKVSAGCKNCYMYREQKHYGHDPNVIRRAAKATFNAPLHWTGPRRVFPCSWSDFFIEEADEWRREAWDMIWTTPHLTYQILTKRPERIPTCLPYDWGENGYPNVWLGVSVENMDRVGRIDELLHVPAPVHWISAEPLLGPLDLRAYLGHGIEWIVGGGESGPGYRVCDKLWVMDLMEQCHAARVPFFFKQWGGTMKIDGAWGGDRLEGVQYHEFPACAAAERI